MLLLREDRPDRSGKPPQPGVKASLYRFKEKLYERLLKRPLDDQTRAAIHSEFRRRRNQIPVPVAELSRTSAKPELTIRSQWISIVVDFSQERMVVGAEMSLRPKCLPLTKTRRDAVRFIESVADQLNLDRTL